MENSIEDRIEEKYTRYLNCETDILELTIEEAIFILETDAKVHYVEDLLQEVYKVILSAYKRVLKENEELKNAINVVNKEKGDWIKAYQEEKDKQFKLLKSSIPIQKIKNIIDRIDYDIEKTKEIISKNTNINASYRKNDYQIVRLRAMNTKSLDIKKRLQELLKSEEINERKRI